MSEKPPVFHEETPEYGRDHGRGWIGFDHASSGMSTCVTSARSDPSAANPCRD